MSKNRTPCLFHWIPSLWIPERNQLNADKCFDFMKLQHPEIAGDPSSLLLAVTSTDLYIPLSDGGMRKTREWTGRYAIISVRAVASSIAGAMES